MNILILDDIATNRKLLRIQLEAEGHHILEAADGVEALQILECEKTEAIISDILMPNMDGFRLCLEVRGNPKLAALPFVIYTSTYTSPQDMQLADTVGADKYVMKPASVPALLEALSEAVKKSECRIKPAPAPIEESVVMKCYSEALVRNPSGDSARCRPTLNSSR